VALAHSPKIATDGLVLCLDAGNTKSYPGSGTTWSDLSGNGYNFSLINSLTFNSANGGGIEQDGSNEYIERAYTPELSFNGNTSFTLQIVAKNNNLLSNYPSIASNGDPGGIGGGWDVFLYDDNNFGGEYGIIIFGRYQSGSSFQDAGGTCSYFFTSETDANSTNFWCYTYSSTGGGKLYRNGNLIVSNSSTGSITRTLNPNVYIGKRTNGNVTNCTFYQFSAYNRALSASEVKQNFNALRGRFGL
jgi:hypothetical protein